MLNGQDGKGLHSTYFASDPFVELIFGGYGQASSFLLNIWVMCSVTLDTVVMMLSWQFHVPMIRLQTVASDWLTSGSCY